MLTRFLTTHDDSAPSVDAPEPDTDRGLPNYVGVSAIAFAVTVSTMVVFGVLTGDPVTWSDALRVFSNGLTAAGVAGGLQWILQRDEGS